MKQLDSENAEHCYSRRKYSNYLVQKMPQMHALSPRTLSHSLIPTGHEHVLRIQGHSHPRRPPGLLTTGSTELTHSPSLSSPGLSLYLSLFPSPSLHPSLPLTFPSCPPSPHLTHPESLQSEAQAAALCPARREFKFGGNSVALWMSSCTVKPLAGPKPVVPNLGGCTCGEGGLNN